MQPTDDRDHLLTDLAQVMEKHLALFKDLWEKGL